MKVYLNKEYKCVKVEDNTFVANDSSNYIRYYFVTNANGDVIDKMDDTSVIYRNTEPSYVTVAFRRADGDVIQHLMASPKTDTTGKSFFEYEITNTDGVLYKKGALEISAQFIEATLSEAGGVKKVISQKVKAIAINTAHVLDNIGEEAEEYYSQYEQANNDAHAVLQTQITTNFNNIGTLQELTTDAKDDLVKAINEVDAHADANKSAIGDLSNLTTDEKTTIVGAINEVDAHSDANKAEIGNLSALTTDEKATLVGAINEVDAHTNTAQQAADAAQATADNATTLANTGISKADRAQTTANTAVDKANDAKSTAQEAIMKADARATSIGFMTAKDAVTALNGYPRTQLKGGDTIWIVEEGTPDLWVTEVAENSVPYNYTTKDKFNQDLVDNKVLQIGYFKTAYQESDGKPVTIAWQNVLVKSTDWVASTEFADFPYEAKIELTDFVDYTTVPQVVFDIADTMSGNYAPICKSGDKCVYIYGKVQNEITLKTVITFAPNVNGASVTGGGYNNRGKWVASTTYAIDDLVYTDNGQFVCVEGITSTTSPEQDTQHWQATFVATGKTKNTLTISGQDNGTGVQKTFDGSTPVEVAFDETTMTAKEVNGVLKIGAKGTIPEALPQEASALKSGELPTSGWGSNSALWTGSVVTPSNSPAPANPNMGFLPYTFDNVTDMLAFYGTKDNWSIIIDGKRVGANSFVVSSTYPSRAVEANFLSGYNCYVRIFVTGAMACWYNTKAGTITEVSNTKLAKPIYTISDTDITENSDVLMELTDEGGVKANALASGSITLIRDTVPTSPIPYTYKVKQTNASGQFTLVNHFVPSIPENPTSLPVTYKKASGSLPTSGWSEIIVQNLLTKNISVIEITTLTETNKVYSQTIDAKYYGVLQGWKIKLLEDNKVYDAVTAMVTVGNEQYMEISYKAVTGFKFNIYLDKQGNIFYADHGSGGSTYTFSGLSNSTVALHTYSISDTSITANTAVKMYLTDEGGVKAQSKAVGSITVIRDEVPTSAIPYEYEVEETSAEGLFEVVNAYVPTKTSELTNDSGFAKTTETNTWTGVQTFSNSDGIKTDRVHNLDNNDAWYNFDGANNRFGSPSRPTIIRTSEARPRAQVPSGETTVTKEIALLEDVPSAGAWVDVTGEATTLTQAGTYQFVTTAEKVQSIMYWDGTTSAVGIPAVALNVNNSSPEVITLTPVVDTAGRLIIHKETLIKENNAWVVKGSAISTGFKYRKIN